jgi:two-component system response regulator YesN
VLTGYREFEYALEAVNLGVLRMIMKPSRIEDIVDALEAAITEIGASKGGPEEHAPAAEEGPGNFLASKAVKYIMEHYAEKITLEAVANHLFVSTWYLCKVLKKATNKNFIDIVNGARIENAKKLLAETYKKVYEISEMVGFGEIAYFSRIFKKMTGMTPNEYRNCIASKAH